MNHVLFWILDQRRNFLFVFVYSIALCFKSYHAAFFIPCYKYCLIKVSQMEEDRIPESFQKVFAALLKSSLFDSCTCKVLSAGERILLDTLKREVKMKTSKPVTRFVINISHSIMLISSTLKRKKFKKKITIINILFGFSLLCSLYMVKLILHF